MLIAEELFLLLRRDDGKAESAMAQNGYGLSGAVITDLILADRVTVSDDKDPVLTVLDAGPTGHPVLDGALRRLVEKDGSKLSKLVPDGKLNPEQSVAASLAAAGVVTIEEKRALGLVPAKYPVRDPEPERALRERLRTAIAGGTPSPADATLLAVLQGLDIAAKVLEKERGPLGKRDLKRRIEEVSEESVAGLAVGRAVRAANQAMMTAVVIPVVVSTTSS